ncbi:MAG: hypothetical protein ACRC7S_09190 [Cetobacterium sp.]
MKLRTFIIVFTLIALSIVEVEFKNTYYIFTLLVCYVGLFIGLNKSKINKFL